MQIIEITVRDRVATKVGDEYYVCGNSDYVIHFDFDEEWDALDIKTARFIAEGNILYPDQIFSGSECPMPVISNTNNIKVGVFAGNLQTTTPARIPAYKSILCGTSTPAAPEEDAYHQAMEEMAKVATEARTQAAASAQSAEASAKSAKAAAQSAVEADASAKNSAQAAETVGQYFSGAQAAEAAAHAHAEAAAKSASASSTSAENAEKAKQAAIDNADDAEEAAKSAQEWAGRADAFAGNAGTSAQEAAASAQSAAASSQAAGESAQASAQDAAAAAQIVVEMTGGAGGLYLVKNVDGYANRTQEEIRAAVKAGKTCLYVHTDGAVFPYYGEVDYPLQAQGEGKCPTFVRFVHYAAYGMQMYSAYVFSSGEVMALVDQSVTRTPSPYKLTLTGAVSATYDGSEAVTVEIPQGGSGGGESGPREVTILAETALTAMDAETGTYALLTPFDQKPAGGMLCTVTYNGTDYQCPAAKFEAPDGNAVALGNFALLGIEGGNTDAPFVMVCAPDGTEGMYAMMMATDSPSGVTVGITAKVVDEAIRAYVDNKVGDALSAIPEPEADVLTVTADMHNLNVTNVSHTYAEIVEAIKAGKAVQMVVSQGEIGQTIVAPLITWNESGNNRMLMFQAMALAEEGAAVTITFNGNTGSINAEFRELDIAPPEKGVDYWTDADKAEIIADVIAALDAAEGVNF